VADDPTPIDATADGVHHVMRFGVVERTECCDCGLVHRELLVPDPGCPTRLHVYSWRDEEATVAARKLRGDAE